MSADVRGVAAMLRDMTEESQHAACALAGAALLARRLAPSLAEKIDSALVMSGYSDVRPTAHDPEHAERLRAEHARMSPAPKPF